MTPQITFDTGALVALEQGQRKARNLWHTLFVDEIPVCVPAAVLAEWWHKDVQFGRKIMKAVKVEELSQDLAMRAGEARSECGDGPSAVDAIVMTSAADRGGVVYTVDHSDLQKFQNRFPNVRLLSPQ